MELKDLVKFHRSQKHLSQRELAELSRIDLSTIFRIEKGEILELKSEALKRLAEALDVSVDYLIGRIQGMEIADIIRINPAAKDIFANYAKLSAEGKRMTGLFIKFLIEQEQSDIRNRIPEEITPDHPAKYGEDDIESVLDGIDK